MGLRRPWNRVDYPVYSVATSGNMNICTYAIPITLSEKKYAVAVYEGTKTLENLKNSGDLLLQILSENQYNLVRKLGKQSGHSVDKLRTFKNNIAYDHDLPYLVDCLAYLRMRIETWVDAGDHKLAICTVLAAKNLREGNPLTVSVLREKGIIRA